MSKEFNECDMQRIMEQSSTVLPEKICKDCGSKLSFNPIRFYGGFGCVPCANGVIYQPMTEDD